MKCLYLIGGIIEDRQNFGLSVFKGQAEKQYIS